MHKYLFLLLASYFSHAQTLTGTVKDSLGNPLANANVIAKPLVEKQGLKFSIADHFGRYKLELEKGVPYEVRVSYLGYKEAILNLEANSELKEHHFKLKETGQQLKEIVIDYEYKPIIVKKDTLIYNVQSFANGNERKMKEVLEKLPGVEVGKDGSVTVQGKKVTQMMVEGKSFFGGGSKLAVENIPADALDKIEVIDNFNKVGFLKQVSDSDELAMNVKLKEDKKKFVFGDLEAGAEVANDNGFHLLHTALFYYSPKTNVSFIGDINNIGKRTFTFEDMMRFQGGASSFISGRKQLTNLYSFATGNTDVIENKSQFGAFNFRQEINSKLDVEGFGIFSKLFTATLSESQNEYLQNSSFTFEDKTNKGNNKSILGIGNIKLNYSPSDQSRWFYNSQYQFSTNDITSQILSIRDGQQNTFENINNADNSQVKQFLEWHKQYKNKNHTTTFVINQSYENKKPQNSWLTDTEFLTGLIPLQNDSFYTIEQIKKVKNNSIDALFKHYWILNNYNHIYTNIGNNFGTTSLEITEKQYLTDGTINDFATGGFGNDLNYLLNDFYVGFEYKFKIGKWVNKPALYTHFYHLKTRQILENYTTNKTYFEPQWNSEYEFNQSEALKFNYKLSNDFPDATKLLERYTLQSYNSVFKGNALLKNERFHTASLRYSKTSMYRGLMLFANLNYNKKIKTIRNVIELAGINQFTTPTITDNPETNWRFYGNLSKKINRIRIQLNSNLSWFNYIQSLNGQTTSNNRNNQSVGLKIRTATKKWPSVSIGYDKSFSQFSGLTKSSFTNDVFSFDFDIDFLQHFNFKTDYEITFNENSNNQKTNYRIGNASLSYHKKDHPFRFELSAQNYLNNGTKINNSFSDFLISNNTTYILPRVIMLSISYKL
ncbi:MULTISPECIES: carboxypeptidase-like regulatory domain-containing protein [Flavobacterium]|uniref:Carboxypeptidase-like regulatory domain-containing protein n=1 Tax=Flavobacterium jumunjinense TaxID=998845 RepID=A0ABV5GKS8_9FLAO|nr:MULTISPECIES: carboxypeptidase-like regulatory domain-containing protein [Flavobacterium]